jgi:hypothetical protein
VRQSERIPSWFARRLLRSLRYRLPTNPLVLGDLLLDEGDHQRAAARYERGRALAESLVAAGADDMRAAAFLAIASEGLGRSASGRRDRTAAAMWFRRAMNIWRSRPTKDVSSEYDQSHHLREAERLQAAVSR